MALQLPTIFPVGYNGDYTDFLRTKSSRDGDGNIITGSVSIPSGTISGTIVGLWPFNRGMKLGYGSWFNIGALGTSVTLSLGWYYYDTTLGTSNTAGYAAASTTAAAGGTILPSVVAGAVLDPVADGWVVAVTGGATTGSTGALTFNASIFYDISGVTN